MDTNKFQTKDGIIYEVESCSSNAKGIRVIVHHPADLEGLNPQGYKTRQTYGSFGSLFQQLQWVKAVPLVELDLRSIA